MPFYSLSFENDIRKLMTPCSDTLIKAIFGCIFAHIDRYSGNFLPNSIFEFFQGMRSMLNNIFLRVATQKEAGNTQIEF